MVIGLSISSSEVTRKQRNHVYMQNFKTIICQNVVSQCIGKQPLGNGEMSKHDITGLHLIVLWFSKVYIYTLVCTYTLVNNDQDQDYSQPQCKTITI